MCAGGELLGHSHSKVDASESEVGHQVDTFCTWLQSFEAAVFIY